MLQETLSSASKRKLPSFTPLSTSPRSFSPPSNPASSTSSSPSVSADLESLNLLHYRRHSPTPTFTTSDTSEDELETPPTSPRPPTLPLPRSKATLGNPVDWLHYPLSIAEICDEDDTRGPSFDWLSSPAHSTLPKLPPSNSTSLDIPPAPITPSPSSLPHPSSARPQSTQPTRQEEEASRGRNRAPRLLWRSEIDEPSMEVLNQYYSQMRGSSLPTLKKGMRSREIREWRRRVEEAGI